MKKAIKYRHSEDHERNEAEASACLMTYEESLTQQHFAEDADINVISRRFGLDKAPLPVQALDPSYYGDFTNVPDLRTALDIVREATNRFMDLPARLRARFDNSPAKLWHFVNDPENGPEAVRLGLLKAKEPEGVTPPPAPPQTDTN